MKKERSDFRNAVYEVIQDSGQFKKNLVFFFADIRLDSRGGIDLKENFTFSVCIRKTN